MARGGGLSAPVVCSIGTMDPWNAAGLGLDIRVLHECGARAVTVVAAISAQDEHGIRALRAVDPEMIRAQWTALAAADVRAVRIGALCGAPAVRAIADMLATANLPVVVDPVLGASRGGTFADAATVELLKSDLVRAATICTPNMAEAATLSGRDVRSVDDMEAAARDLLALGARAVLVTGGHLTGDPIDVLAERDRTTRFGGTRIAGTMRGTGCVLSAALAAELAKSTPLHAAIERARAVVRKQIAHAVRAGDFWVAD